MDSIDAVFAEVHAGSAVPGVVAGIARPDGVSYLSAFGASDPDSGRPMAVDSVFRIASMTKAITSVAAMQLVESGDLDLDASVAELLPDLAQQPVLTGFDDGGRPQTRAAASPITLRQLLSHSSGLGYHIWNASLGQYAEAEGIDGVGLFLGLPLVHEPGTAWEYSISTDWVGRAVEEASGLGIEDYFQERILRPLGMVDTGFEPGPSQLERLVTLGERQADGSWRTSEIVMPTPEGYHSGGGGLASTVPDYLRFLRALLRGGELDGARILQPETVAMMGENQIGDLVVREMPDAGPMSRAFLIGPEGEGKFGLGFHLNTEPLATGRSAGGMAWAGLLNTHFWLDPTAAVAGVIAMQTLPFFDEPSIALFEAFETATYAASFA